ncbi:MAG: glycosyltransferase family 39 protein, partial [Bacteroidetes bacterium]|nr:glycosyltransferase family 39 protein [Bacteroidota bacterium]
PASDFRLLTLKNTYSARSINTILLLLIIVAFIIVKIPYLSLPYYWDEAWVYGSAIRAMEAAHISLLPDALPVHYSRGHPLLFHFTGALWLRVFGTSLMASHIFALLISVALIVSIYYFVKNIFSKRASLLACLFIVLQPIFLAQSVLVLPEIMLSLFSLLTLYFFIQQKWIGYLITGTLALYTKETGIVAIAAAITCQLTDILFLKRKEDVLKSKLAGLLITTFPLALITFFFIIQKQVNGWYFFPEHIDFLSHDLKTFSDRLVAFSAQLFVYWGKNLLTAAILASLFLFFYFKHRLNNKQNKTLLILSIYIVLFLISSSFNFYSDRYVMSMVAPFCIIAASLIDITFTKRILVYLFVVAYAALQIFMYIPQKTSSDHNLGYADCVKVHQQMVNYCTENRLMDRKFFTHFLMMANLTNPYCGYIREDQRFTSVTSTSGPDIELYIFNNMEGHDDYEKMKGRNDITLVKRFQLNHAWSEIYEVKK